MPKGQKIVDVKDLPAGAKYIQSDRYQGPNGHGVVPANSKAPSVGKPAFPPGYGTLVNKTKK